MGPTYPLNLTPMKIRNPFSALPTLSADTARPFSDRLDWCLFGITLLVGAVFAYYIKQIGLSLVLVDQFSHLSIARQVTDSLTPGMSQVGFWPPLLHVILSPVAVFDWLYYSGYASAVVLVPLLGLTTVWLARLLFLLSSERSISYGFALLLLLNPYVLYFSVTPMMEILFLAMLTGATYYFARWWLTSELTALIYAGALISLASLSRFEGFILIPLVSLLVIIRLLIERVSLSQIEAILLIFGLIATTGVMFTLAYGFVYNGDPLAFMSNNWGAYAQQRDLALPAEGNLMEAATFMGAAAIEMVGIATLLATVVAFGLLVVTLAVRRFLIFSIITILLSPFLFDILAAYQGSAVVYVPYLWPYPDSYFNVRYGLLLIIAVITITALTAAFMTRTLRGVHRWLPVHFLPAIYLGIFMVVASASFSISAGCSTCFVVIQKSQQISPADHTLAAMSLKEQYDGGFILMTRALHNEIAVRAEIPLSHYILEANEHYYARALEAPWWYARYVVMFNPSEAIHQDWQRENEQVSHMWAGHEKFNYFYEQIFLSDGEAIYKIREDNLREYALVYNIPFASLPALQTTTRPWDVESTYEQIETAIESKAKVVTLTDI